MSADMARVCGLIWDAHPLRLEDAKDPKILNVIKIEHVIALLPILLRSST